ncbi:MAG: glycosyltransferase [Caldilineaceae bacterium]
MKTLLFYCQHVLGMGHLMRSKALVEGLVGDFKVAFLNGGELIPGVEFPDEVEVINLPPLKSDAAFTGIQAVDGQSLAQTKRVRADLLLESYTRLQPDALVIELFPFGRKKFAFELMPLLARIRRDKSPTKVVCSLRDIMVSRRDQWKHEARACRLLNRYFDLLLVHADPTFQRLEESFGQVAAIETPLVYTGYVAQQEEAEEPAALEPLIPVQHPMILASIGGGRVGSELLLSAVAASVQLAQSRPHQLIIFGGPYIPDAEFVQLRELVAGQGHIVLQRFTNHFLHYMAQADLSLSMAGYNTCMNLLTTGARSLLFPFTGGDNDEQSIRAQKLAQLGAVGVLESADLTPERLAIRMAQQLNAPPPTTRLDLDGVAKTAAALLELVSTPLVTPAVGHRTRQLAAEEDCQPTIRHLSLATIPGAAQLQNQLRPFLERFGEVHSDTGRPVHLFLRDDDVDDDEETLRELLDVALARGVPINLEIIPNGLTDAGSRLIADHKRFTPHLVGLDQHGWQHLNHEPDGRKCEFGPSRTYAQQYDDIARGKALLESTFEDLFTPVFTPPWNRYTADTLQVIDELGFAAFSGLLQNAPVTGYGFQDLSVTLDLYRWKGGAVMKDPALIVADLIDQIHRGAPIGLLLHHKVMDVDAFAFLDGLLATLRRYPFIHFHTFITLQKVAVVPCL